MAADKRIVLITGANQGIGYFAAQHFASTGKYIVLIGSRDLIKGQKAVQDLLADETVKIEKDTLTAIQLDITSDESINAAVQTTASKYGRLDILINNAGINIEQTTTSLRQRYTDSFATNTTSAAVTTEAFLPLLRKSTVPNGKRIIFTSSGLGSLTLASEFALHYSAAIYPVYRTSKTALNMVMLHFAAVLEQEGFIVGSVCPGFCGTNLNAYTGTKDPRDGAKILLVAAEGKKEDVFAKVLSDADGIPIICQGQEQHMRGGVSPYTNCSPLWTTSYNISSSLYKHIALLNKFRQHVINTSKNDTTYMNEVIFQDYHSLAMRKGYGGSQVIAVLNNNGESTNDFNLAIPNHGFQAGVQLTEVLSFTNLTVNSTGYINLPMEKGQPKIMYPTNLLYNSSPCGLSDHPPALSSVTVAETINNTTFINNIRFNNYFGLF
ncbi:Hypothetical protein R9X50_00317900 [Acrodontium crateriforme]|uniref:Alpha-amylase domain-containing protein n=1 Tax=Acrodontium crateriforme TaxID=150365 RepID=A0AAQ3M592_9PEZI|nr:Hypothetical protein R9X50_00317900 [Acrodontium crateriforme]